MAPSHLAARAKHCLCGGASVRRLAQFDYRTRESWGAPRRVIGKAELSARGDAPRFIVTNLAEQRMRDDGRRLLLEGDGRCSAET
jgi:hypothetical protein